MSAERSACWIVIERMSVELVASKQEKWVSRARP
jgi:hypothetical protein